VISRSERRRRWLRRLALAIRIAVGLLTLSGALVAAIVVARMFGQSSPWFWTIALLVGIGGGLLVMGNPAIHRVADRLERAAEERQAAEPDETDR